MPVEIAPGIEVDPNIRFGRPVIKGIRVPVDMVLSKLAGGMSPEEVVGEYGITLEDIRCALAYAARIVADEEIRLTA